MSLSSKLFAAAAVAALGLGSVANAATVQRYQANTGGEWGVNYYTQIDLDTLGVGVEGVDFNVKYNGWENLTSTSGIAATYLTTGALAQQGTSADNTDAARLLRTAGAHFPASLGLYSFSTGSAFQIVENNPLADVSQILFQVVLGETRTPLGEADAVGNVPPENWVDANGNPSPVPVYPIDDDNFSFDGLIPTLFINGDTVNGIAGTAELFNQHHGVESSIGTVTLNENIFAWDVSSLGPITSFAVDFGVRVHSVFPEVALYQTDYVAPTVTPGTSAVPEPATASLLALGGLALLSRRRRN